MGTGTLDMVERCVSAGLREPEFEASGEFVTRIWRAPLAGQPVVFTGRTGFDAVTGEKTGEKADPPGEKTEGTREIARENTKEKILALIAADPEITTARMAEEIGISRKGIEWQIRRLKSTGRLERIGPDVGVYPPNGRVRVAVPLRLDDDAVRLALISRLGWIRRQQAGFENQDRQSQREFVTGESHYFNDRRYRLDVIEHHGVPAVRLRNNTTMELRIGPDADREAREATVHRWYRRRLRDQLPALLARWEPEVGVTVSDVRIKKTKTRWGSCNADAGRIWMNLKLARKPASCLAYILVHEMVHFLERDHNDRFRELMDRAMPQWRLHRDELNRAPLAHEEWRY